MHVEYVLTINTNEFTQFLNNMLERESGFVNKRITRIETVIPNCISNGSFNLEIKCDLEDIPQPVPC